jgi:hypothetical protein
MIRANGFGMLCGATAACMTSDALAGYPIGGGSALFPARETRFGGPVGRRFGPFGIYGKMRPGSTADYGQNVIYADYAHSFVGSILLAHL